MGDVAAESQRIWATWRNKFSHLLNLHGVNDVRQSEKHKAWPLVPELAPFEVEMSTVKPKTHKSLDSYQIQVELFQVCLRIFLSKIR